MAQYPLRIPDALYAELKEMAEQQSVSMNQLLVYLIVSKLGKLKTRQEYFRAKNGPADRKRLKDGVEALLDKLPPRLSLDEDLENYEL
jgi:hypothetical protein